MNNLTHFGFWIADFGLGWFVLWAEARSPGELNPNPKCAI
jgi:hypothetical protein